MEYMRSSSVSHSSSNPYMDGVPFKISEATKPPSKVSLPLSFQMPDPRNILSEMYDFEVEQAVLNYAEAQREAEEELEISREEQINQLENNEYNMHTTERGDCPNSSDHVGQPVENAHLKQNGHIGHPEKVNPLLANISSDILTPVPIARDRVNTDENRDAQNARINLADFENEQDPFDNLTLQTINDREELKNLFSVSSQENDNRLVANGIGHNCEENTNNSNIHSQNTGKEINGGENVEVDSVGVTLQTSIDRVSYKPHVAQKPNINTGVLRNGGPGTHKEVLGQKRRSLPESKIPKLPPIGAMTALVSSPLPPIGAGNKVSDCDSTLTNSNLKFGEPSVLSSWDGSRSTQTSYGRYSRHDSAIHESLNLEKSNITASFSASSGPSFQDSRRSSRSTPDISQVERAPLSPYLTTKSPPSRVSSGQVSQEGVVLVDSVSCSASAWNRYSPLPSTPQTSSPPQAGPARATPPPRPAPRERNPYSKLSNESQRLVDSVVSMGFPQARVARAVEKLGMDDKQVVDHLCHLGSLLEKGYTAADAEDALFSFPEQDTKVKDYLEMLTNFKQMGFHPAKVKEALVKHNCDKDKALDQLTQL
ncbi:ubiquitin-associated protein 1-like isoform X1 [Lingula anatina]|uniref:Ubiquitin-associated protein 1-like isoform X1 n=1 Tax=Lingula anatina TaxID=7574 RepID=A0A1S3IDG8_LINAN|nr:ubiquitin-associated protein 1-like isoform X1 [Lingula anatina]|eukprot:XP_013396282.1 ubiquitin-associated protein 1-like isoform X1 [Lingula anatina]